MNIFKKFWQSVRKIVKSISERIINSESHVHKKDPRAESASRLTSAFDYAALEDKLKTNEEPVDQAYTTSRPVKQEISASLANMVMQASKNDHTEDGETGEIAIHPNKGQSNQQIIPIKDHEEIVASTELPEFLISSEEGELPRSEKLEDNSFPDEQLEPTDIQFINQESGVEEDNTQEETEEILPLEQKPRTKALIEDFENTQPIKPGELEIDEQLEKDQRFPDPVEVEKSTRAMQEQQINELPYTENDNASVEIVERNEKVRPKQKRISSRESVTEEPWSPGNYYRGFVLRRKLFQELTDDEVDEFIFKLEQDEIDDILDWSMMKIENYLFESLKRVHLIGELPISKDAFNKLCKYNQYYRISRSDGRLSKQKTIPPAFFITMMVFCARYSEEDARNFWRPYTQLVWGYDEADLSFQNVCRDHFRACREDLADSVGLNFLVYRPGDVVLPVYQHAIIPYHLMEHMANWIVQKFEVFIQFDSKMIQNLISDQDELQYLPHQLQRFLTDEDTSESAAALLRKMSDVIAFFKEKKSTKLVESIIDSPIEKSLWNAIYLQLTIDASCVERIVRNKPKLAWIWDVDEEDIRLRLSSVQSPENQKPSTLYLISDGGFKTASYHHHIRPWQDENKRWIVEKTIPSDALIDSDEIYVVSYKFDLDKNPKEQRDCVLFTHKIPGFADNFIFFRHGLNRKYAGKKETIQSDGNWIIISKTDFELINQNGKSMSYSDYALPRFLREGGFKHVRKYELELPINLVTDEGETPIQAQDRRRYLEPILGGDQPVPGLSTANPPVFQTRSVYLTLQLDPQYPIRKTFFSISSINSVISTASFAELMRNGHLITNDSNIQINLNIFIEQFGIYQIDIIHGLRSLLDEPVEFGYLADIKILPPDLDQIFSPQKPFQVEIKNIDDFILDYPEDTKLVQDDERKILKWKLHKSPESIFSINDSHGGHIELLWLVDRVTAWVEGGFNKNLIEAEQESNALINVRGKPYQEFHWIINNETFIPDKLDVKGKISNTLRYIKIRASLREAKTSLSQIEIDIEDMRWKVFDYLRKPLVMIKEIKFEKGTLHYKLNIRPKLIGQYQLKIMKKGIMAAPVAVIDLSDLQEEGRWKIELSEGDYVLKIHLDNELLAVSERFSYSKPLRYRMQGEKTKPSKDEEINVKAISLDEISAESLFNLLTAEKTQFRKFEQEVYSKIPYFQQLACINDKSYWYIDGKVEDGIKNLLPFWAVTKHPFRFVERKFHKTLIIYPSETALGGILGRGYTHLKVNNQKEIVYAAWKPDSDSNYIKLFLCFPKVGIHPKFFDIDKVSTWYLRYLRPAYQCVDCGDLLGTGEEGFPPNIFNKHLHGGQKFAREQFIDTRREESLDNTLSIFENEKLNFEAMTKNSVVRNCAKLFEKYSNLRKHGELSKPIITTNNLDYSKAFTELFENYKQDDKRDSIRFFMNNKEFFDDLDKFISSLTNEIVPLSAMERLVEVLPIDELLCEIPRFSLNLCTLLRLKAHFEHVYFSFINSRKIEESKLMEMAYAGKQGFPKFMEWSIAWAEIFFVHAIS